MRDGDKPAENRRSRSPERREAGGEGERGRQVCSTTDLFSSDSHFYLLMFDGSDSGVNPGNNLHVSSLSHKVDNRELETVFSKYGKVGSLTGHSVWYSHFAGSQGRPRCHYV